jgi:enterobacterial common antigen flippase
VARMGMDSSGVRQIAEAKRDGNEEKLAHVFSAIRRMSLFFGVLGMVLLMSLSHVISRMTFQNTAHTTALIFLSVGILLETIMAGEVARIQGMRRIGDLARVSVFSALAGTAIGILAIYMFRQEGIVPFLIASSAASAGIAWWYSGKVRVSGVRTSWRGIRPVVKPLLKLGSVVMGADLMGRGTGYFLRVLILREFGLAASGLFQVAMTLSSIYIGFILESMVKDYYPRLTAVAEDRVACNKLVNEQVEIGAILATPGILAMLTFAPIIIPLFYSSKFIGAFEIFQWAAVGMLLRVASWPLSFILQAKGRAGLYLLTDFLMNVAHVTLVWAGLSYFGLNGTGIGFFCMCIFYLIMVYGVAKSVTGFSWSEANVRNALLILPAVCVVALLHLFLDRVWVVILGSGILVAFAFHSFRTLAMTTGTGGFLPLLKNLRERFSAGTYSQD